MRHVHCSFDTFEQSFRYYNGALAKKVKKAYKVSLKLLCEMHTVCEPYIKGKAVYAYEPDFYQVIFSKNPFYQMGFSYTNASWGFKMYNKYLTLCHLPSTTLLYIQ